MRYHLIARDELWEGEMRSFTVAERRVLVANVGGRIVAYEDACAHQRSPLSQGTLCGRVLTCAAHGWEYDAATGEGLNPRRARLVSYPVLVEDGDVVIDLGGDA